jgi:hypothetical protein
MRFLTCLKQYRLIAFDKKENNLSEQHVTSTVASFHLTSMREDERIKMMPTKK